MKSTNPKCIKENSTRDSPFIVDEVFKDIAQLKNKKASGNDSISDEMIKTGSPTVLLFLVTFFNTILETKSYPEDWSCEIITPIHKSWENDNTDIYNRRITINSCLSKLFNLLLTNRRTSFVNEKGILKYNQIGFRKGFYAADHVLTIKTMTDKYLSKNQKLCFWVVNFRKTYISKALRGKDCLTNYIHMVSVKKSFFLLENIYSKVQLSVCLPNRHSKPLYIQHMTKPSL